MTADSDVFLSPCWLEPVISVFLSNLYLLVFDPCFLMSDDRLGSMVDAIIKA